MEKALIDFMQQRVDTEKDAVKCLELYIKTISDATSIAKLTKVFKFFEDLEYRMSDLEG